MMIIYVQSLINICEIPEELLQQYENSEMSSGDDIRLSDKVHSSKPKVEIQCMCY